LLKKLALMHRRQQRLPHSRISASQNSLWYIEPAVEAWI